jgi:uncharacterized protein (DUF2126 family)
VDSSLERIQVKVSGLTADSRFAVVCNGRRVPLQPTTEPGTAVAGVRFRARRLSATLHPTVPVHAPLVFDLIDSWNERSIGQCIYHVEPPDGRQFTARPANAAEASERRLERFQITRPSPGPRTTLEIENNSIFPGTLDLRVPPPSQNSRIERPVPLP